MSIFARRRLQTMLNDLDPLLTAKKANELLGRLENERTGQAIGAEYELAMCWAVSRSFTTTLEPDFKSAPDMLVQDIFARPTVIEVTAISDAGFGQEDDMRRAANILTSAADRLKKASGKHLYFTFTEHRVTRKGQSFRERRVNGDFKLSKVLEQQLERWLLGAEPLPPEKLRLTDEAVDVVVEWKPYVHPLFNFFSSMPAVGQDLEDNVIFKALKAKAKKQLKGIGSEYLKCIFLCDAGCRLLDSGFRTTRQGFEFSGTEIIQHFLKRHDIDLVCVFSVSPWQPGNWQRKPRHWVVNALSDQDLPAGYLDQLHRVCAHLPVPRLSGYQARSRHLQGMFRPEAGQYLNTTLSHGGAFSPVKFKMSARALQEHLAGRLKQHVFDNIIGAEDGNHFARLLDQGYQMSGAQIIPGGIDEDDDHIEFTFSFDPAAMKFRPPEGK